MNSQRSTNEQIVELINLAETEEYDVSSLGAFDIKNLIFIANYNGLYDAADYLETLREASDGPYSLAAIPEDNA